MRASNYGAGIGDPARFPNAAAAYTWVEHWNDDPKPFVWHKTAEEIITKVRRGRATLTQVKSATHD